MPTMLITSRMASRIALLMCMIPLAYSAPTEFASLAFDAATHGKVCVSSAYSKAKSKCRRGLADKNIDRDLRSIIRKSEELIDVLQTRTDNDIYWIFIARIPSKLPHSTGYCGAGYEDKLVLSHYDGKKLTFRDNFLLQSCLSSISLQSDSPNDLLKSISIDHQLHIIRFRWLLNPDDKDHALRIYNGAFKLD